MVMGIGSRGVLADDIGVVPSGAPHSSNIRTRTNQRRPEARPRRTIPRPIQDASTATARPAASRPVPRPAPRRVAPRRTTSRRGSEQAVNLDALTTSRPAAPAHGRSEYAGAKTAGGTVPNFKFYFDFLLRSWKGAGAGTSEFDFESYHQRLMVEYTPTPELMFQADLLGLNYFETDYMLTPRLQARWGRIWIPFDDLAPHSLFGGRINTSKFFQSGNDNSREGYFLPDIWADLGIGLKYTLADSLNFQSELHFYVVNGFHDGGTSPVKTDTGPYPDFSGTAGVAADNNNAKAMGARWHSLFGRRFGLGVSVYKDTYTKKDAEKSLGILMLGIDGQLHPTSTTEIRAGYVTMKVDLDPDLSSKSSFMRGGTYVELGQHFGAEDRWKFLVRAGSSQNDNRVVDVSDKTILGLTLLKNFGSVEAQINYYRDLHQVPLKVAYNYGEFRLVTVF
jgi:hypothetical protein